MKLQRRSPNGLVCCFKQENQDIDNFISCFSIVKIHKNSRFASREISGFIERYTYTYNLLKYQLPYGSFL